MKIIQDKKTGAYLVDVHLTKRIVILAEDAEKALQFHEMTVQDCADTLHRFFGRYDWQVMPCQ